jgi:hypothetical protein
MVARRIRAGLSFTISSEFLRVVTCGKLARHPDWDNGSETGLTRREAACVKRATEQLCWISLAFAGKLLDTNCERRSHFRIISMVWKKSAGLVEYGL